MRTPVDSRFVEPSGLDSGSVGAGALRSTDPADGVDLRAVLDGVPIGVVQLDHRGRIAWANRAHLELLGYTSAELVGRCAWQLHLDETVGRQVTEQALRAGLAGGKDVALRHRDGSVRNVLISSAALRNEAGSGDSYCFFQEASHPHRTCQRLAAENAVVRALAEAPSLCEATTRVLEAVCRTTGWSWGALWSFQSDDAEKVLRCTDFWHRPDRPALAFEAHTRRLTFRRGAGLPGGVWATGCPEWTEDIAAADELTRGGEGDVAAEDGVHGALAFPILARDGSVLGVMQFFSRHPREPDAGLLDLMRAIGRQLGQAVERRRGEEALARSEAGNAAIVRAALDGIVSVDDRGFVLEWNPAAERMFGYARSEAMDRDVAELIVPPALRDQHSLGLVRDLLTGEPSALGQRVETRAVRKGGGEFPVELAVARVAGTARPTFTAYVRDISERRRADETTSSLRAALQELLVARDIQESVLPKVVPRLPGIEVAGMVRAAAQCSGDFYDYLATPDGRTVILLGDVAGHGVGPALVAAEAATCLRTLVRTYGRVDHLLTEANAILADATPSATFVTMVVLSIDPATRVITYASAGHPSGLVIGPDQRVKAELDSMDLPLAVSRDVVFQQGAPVTLEAGDLVVLVSDGLLEAWSPEGVAFGRQRLREAACALQPESASTVVERLYDVVRAFACWAPQHDDMSAVAIKVTGDSGGDRT